MTVSGPRRGRSRLGLQLSDGVPRREWRRGGAARVATLSGWGPRRDGPRLGRQLSEEVVRRVQRRRGAAGASAIHSSKSHVGTDFDSGCDFCMETCDVYGGAELLLERRLFPVCGPRLCRPGHELRLIVWFVWVIGNVVYLTSSLQALFLWRDCASQRRRAPVRRDKSSWERGGACPRGR